MPRPFVVAFALPLLLAHEAWAQRPVEIPTQPAVPAAPVTPTPIHALSIPAPPDVEDPMLTAVPRAKIEVATWDDALKHIRARSTDLQLALADVQRAEAQSRVALAGALPTINGTITYTHNLITNEGYQFGGQGVSPVRIPYRDYFTGGIAATQPVLALRAWNAIGTAHRSEEAAELSVSDTKRVIAQGVANAIVGVVTAERISELNRIGLRNALQRLELTTRKADSWRRHGARRRTRAARRRDCARHVGRRRRIAASIA